MSDEEFNEQLTMYLNSNGMESEEEMARYTAENYSSKLDDLINEAVILEKVLDVIGHNIVEISDVPESSSTDDGNTDAGNTGAENADAGN